MLKVRSELRFGRNLVFVRNGVGDGSFVDGKSDDSEEYGFVGGTCKRGEGKE